MAIQFMEGFDSFNTASLSTTNFVTDSGSEAYFDNSGTNISSFSINASITPFAAGKSYRQTGSGMATLDLGYVVKLPFVTNNQRFTVGTYLNYDVAGVEGPFMHFQAAGTNLFSIAPRSDGRIRIQTSNSTTVFLAESAAGVVTNGSWLRVEVDVTINTSGNDTIEVFVNDVSVLSFTGAVTNTLPDRVRFGCGFSANTVLFGRGNYYFDDIYVLNNNGTGRTTRLGAWRIEAINPTSEDVNTNVTYTGGTNVSDRVGANSNDGDTTYAQAAGAVGDGCIYDSTGTLSGNPTTIFAVSVSHTVKRTDAGSRNTCNLIKESGGTVTEGASTALLSNYGFISSVWESRPSDSAAWTRSEVEALRFGFRVKA